MRLNSLQVFKMKSLHALCGLAGRHQASLCGHPLRGPRPPWALTVPLLSLSLWRSHGGGAATGGAVLLQQRHAAEGARADATLVLLHLSVSLQVSSQVGTVGEGPVAVGAGERTLTWTERKEKTHQKMSDKIYFIDPNLRHIFVTTACLNKALHIMWKWKRVNNISKITKK